MKKYFIPAIAMLAIVITLASLGFFLKPKPVVTPTGMTAEETVRFYFEQWNNKNAKAMDSVVRENRRFGKISSTFVYVKLTKCVDETEKNMEREGSYFSRTYPGYVEYAIVEVEFEIEHKSGGLFDDAGGGFGHGKTYVAWRYTLGKKDVNSDWEILGWGAA